MYHRLSQWLMRLTPRTYAITFITFVVLELIMLSYLAVHT